MLFSPFTVPVTVNLYVPFSVTLNGIAGLTVVVPPSIKCVNVIYNGVSIGVFFSGKLSPFPLLFSTIFISFTIGLVAIFSNFSITQSELTVATYPSFSTSNLPSSPFVTESTSIATCEFKNSSKLLYSVDIGYSSSTIPILSFTPKAIDLSPASFAFFTIPLSPNTKLMLNPASINKTTIVITKATNVIPFFICFHLLFIFHFCIFPLYTKFCFLIILSYLLFYLLFT